MFIYSVSVSEESFYIWKTSNSCLEGITSLSLSCVWPNYFCLEDPSDPTHTRLLYLGTKEGEQKERERVGGINVTHKK